MNPTFRTVPVILGAAVAFAGPAAAQDVRAVSLEEALGLFAENNLDLQVARSDAAAAAGLARQAGAFPNPSFAATHERLSGDGDAEDADETYLNLSQRLEWPGTRSARSRAADEREAAAWARLAADSARLAFEVKEAYLRAAMAGRAEALLEQVTEVFRDGVRSVEARFADGDVSLYDRRRVEVERIRYEGRLAEASLEAVAARRALALLVLPEGEVRELAAGDPPAGAPPTVTPVDAMTAALERRRELEAARAAARSAEAEVDFARSDRIPDLTATGGYKRQSDGLDGLFLGLSLPLPLWDRNGGAIEAAEARQAASQARASLVRRQVLNDVERAAETYRALTRRAALLTDPAGDDGADLLEIARVAYAEGEMTLLELLDAAEAHLEAGLTGIRLQAELWTGYYDLERAVGGFDGSSDDLENER